MINGGLPTGEPLTMFNQIKDTIMKQNKFKYLRIIQQYIPDCGWCDVVAYNKNDREQMKSLRADLKVYRENEPYALRVVSRRMLATEQFHA